MPPKLALLLCAGFVLYLLAQERKHLGRLSPALWVPTLWVLYCGSRPIAAWFNQDDLSRTEYDIEAGSGIDRYFLLGLICLGVLILLRRRIDWSRALQFSTPFLVLFLYMGVSVIWSDYSWVSLKRWIKVSGAVVMAWIVLTDPAPRAAMEAILFRGTIVLIPFSAMLVKYYTGIGVYYNRWTGESMWVGVTTQKNSLGRLCLVCGLYLIWSYLRKKKLGREMVGRQPRHWMNLLLFGLTLWLLKGCDSATSMVVLGLGGVILGVLMFSKEAQREVICKAFAVAIGVILSLTAYLFVNGTLPAIGVESLGRDATFTGRTEIWAKLFPVAWQAPILGIGYGSFWINPLDMFPGINEGHNGYLDVVLEIGFVGLFMLAFTFLSFFSNLRRNLARDLSWSSLGIAYLLVFMVHNLTETSFIRTTAHLWTMFVLLYFVIPASRERSLNSPEEDATKVGPVEPPGVLWEGHEGGARA